MPSARTGSTAAGAVGCPPRTRIFISHSATGDKAAARLRDAVAERLADEFDVLLDKRLLRPGDRWRGAVHRWLGTCDAAVAILTPKALKSPWVLKELTIVTWRQSLSGRPPIIPIVLGCTVQQVTGDDRFAPLQLDESQFLNLTRPVVLENVLSEVTARVRALAPTTDSSPMHDWVGRVAFLLERADRRALEDARRVLGVEDEDWAQFADREVTLAHQLLHSTLAEAASALRTLKPGLRPMENFADLVSLIIPVWVPELSARQIGEVARRPLGRRVVFVPALYQQTVMDCVMRSTLCRAEESDFVTVTGVTGGDPERELLAAYRRGIQDELGLLDRPVERVARVLNNERYPRKYLLVDSSTPTVVVEALRTEYGGAVLVLHGLRPPERTASMDRLDVTLGCDEDEIDEQRIELWRLTRRRQT